MVAGHGVHSLYRNSIKSFLMPQAPGAVVQWRRAWDGSNTSLGRGRHLDERVVVAAAIWGPQLAGRHVCFHSDNMKVVACLQKGSTKSSHLTDLTICVLV